MSFSYLDQILTPSTQEAVRLRSIENYYQVRQISTDVRSLVDFERRQYQLQAVQVVNNYHSGTSVDLSPISDQLGEISDLIWELEGTISDGFEMLDDTISAGFEEVVGTLNVGFDMMASALNEGFGQVVSELQLQNQTLDDISKGVREPNETRCTEMIEHAYRRLRSAMKTGVSQEGFRSKDYQDAYNLLLRVVHDPIGKLLPGPWFNLGWLEWKFRNNPKRAHSCFLEAVRLERDQPTDSYWNYLNHLAYLQYLVGEWGKAVETATLANEVSEKARYHADYTIALAAAQLWKKRAEEEHLQLALVSLQYLLESWPHLTAAILHEKGFLLIKNEVKHLIARLTRSRRSELETMCLCWQFDHQCLVWGYEDLGTDLPALSFCSKAQVICRDYSKMGLVRLSKSMSIISSASEELVPYRAKQLDQFHRRERQLLEGSLASIDKEIRKYEILKGEWQTYPYSRRANNRDRAIRQSVFDKVGPEPTNPIRPDDWRFNIAALAWIGGITWLIAIAIAGETGSMSWNAYLLLIFLGPVLLTMIIGGIQLPFFAAYRREELLVNARLVPWNEQYHLHLGIAVAHAQEQVKRCDQLIEEQMRLKEPIQAELESMSARQTRW